MSRSAALRQGRDRRRRRVGPDRGRPRQVGDAAPRRGRPQRPARRRPEPRRRRRAVHGRTSRRPRSASTWGSSRSYADGTNVGGSLVRDPRRHAAAAIADGPLRGRADHPRRERPLAGRRCRRARSAPQTMLGQFEEPFGLPRPVGSYALACTRHMAAVRHDQGAACRDRGGDPQVGRAQPEGDVSATRSPSRTCSTRG